MRLEFAQRESARFILASTSEVHRSADSPAAEHYWGNVNLAGPRSVCTTRRSAMPRR